MSSTHLASTFADPPVYAAGQAARPCQVPGAATRAPAPGGRISGGRVLIPALWFLSGLAAGAAVSVAIARALVR